MILKYDTEHTKELLGQQLQIRLNELEDSWHYTSLEKIFFENRVYKILEEDQKTWDAQIKDVLARMLEYQDLLKRKITMDDILKLVEKPVRKISKFDTKVIDEKIRDLEKEMGKVRDNLDHLTEYTIKFFKGIRDKYGKDFPRRTEITGFETIAATKVVSNNAKLYANMAEGFVADLLLAQEHAEAVLCVILKQGVCPCGAVAFLVDGVGRGGSRSAPEEDPRRSEALC